MRPAAARADVQRLRCCCLQERVRTPRSRMYGRRAVTAAAHPDRGAADGAESVHEWTRLQFKRRLRESEEEEQEEEDARAAKQGRADALFPLPSFPSSRPSSPSSSWPPLAPLYSRLLRLSSKRVDAFTALMASHGSAACNTARQGGGQPARPKRKKEQQQQQRSPLTTATATPLDHPLSLASTAQLSSPSSQQCEVPTSSSSSSSSSSFSPSTSRAGGGVQSHLDFGQLVAGLTRCPDCLCTYHAGQAEDERLHAQQHQTHMHGPPFHVRGNTHAHTHSRQHSSLLHTSSTHSLPSSLCCYAVLCCVTMVAPALCRVGRTSASCSLEESAG